MPCPLNSLSPVKDEDFYTAPAHKDYCPADAFSVKISEAGHRVPETQNNFPDGLEPQGEEEAAQWVLRSLKDIDKHGGRCQIQMDVAPSTLVTMSELIEKEISELEVRRAENIYEDWFDRRTLEDLKKLKAMLEEANLESVSRYASSGRPKAFDMRVGEPTEMRFTREWMELMMKEDLASVRSPRRKQA